MRWTLFKEAGGDTVVEVSSRGLGRDVLGLKQIAESSGVNIIAGSGYYKVAGHPPDMAERSVEDVTAEIVRELESGIGDTGIRAGVIGEIATGSPLYDVPLDVWDLRDHEDIVPQRGEGPAGGWKGSAWRPALPFPSTYTTTGPTGWRITPWTYCRPKARTWSASPSATSTPGPTRNT